MNMNLDFLNEAAPAKEQDVAKTADVSLEATDDFGDAVDLNAPATVGQVLALTERVLATEKLLNNINARLNFCANTGQLFMLSSLAMPGPMLEGLGVLPTPTEPKPPMVRPATDGRRHTPLPGFNGVKTNGE